MHMTAIFFSLVVTCTQPVFASDRRWYAVFPVPNRTGLRLGELEDHIFCNRLFRMQCSMHRNRLSISLSPTTSTGYHSPVLDMAHSSNSSNVFVNGTLNSLAVQGDFHVHNKDSESGVHDFHSEERPYQ